MGRVLLASSLNLAVMEAVPPSLVLEGASPIALAKALKNEQELQVKGGEEELCVIERTSLQLCVFCCLLRLRSVSKGCSLARGCTLLSPLFSPKKRYSSSVTGSTQQRTGIICVCRFSVLVIDHASRRVKKAAMKSRCSLERRPDSKKGPSPAWDRSPRNNDTHNRPPPLSPENERAKSVLVPIFV